LQGHRKIEKKVLQLFYVQPRLKQQFKKVLAAKTVITLSKLF